MKIHALRTQPLTETWQEEVRGIEAFIPVDCEFTFQYEPLLLDNVRIENDRDIDEHWLHEETKHIKAHVIYLHLSEDEWEGLGLRDTLWGQSRFIDGKIICYGRWHEQASYQNSHRYEEPVRSMAEQTIGIAHEIAHKLSNLFGGKDLCHYHFYGYKTPDSETKWQRTPTPIEYFESFDWSRLPDLDVPRVDALALHHTAVSREHKNQTQAVDNYHRDEWGLKSSLGYYIGYNFLIDTGGEITYAREIGTLTLAQIGHNCIGDDCVISVCLAGDFNQELPSDEQIESFKDLYEELSFTYPDLKVVGHRDLQENRTCPGKLMTDDYIETRLLGHSETPEDEREKKEALERQLSELRKTYLSLLIERAWQLINKLKS